MPSIDVDAFEDAWDDDAPVGPRGRPLPSRAARERRDTAGVGRVVALDRGRVRVAPEDGGAPFDARFGGAVRGQRVAVGDRVRVMPAGTGVARVVARLERTSELARTSDDLDHRARTVAANLDRVLVVVGADNLAAGLRFADRVLVAAAAGGVGVDLVINKADLVGAVGQPSEVELTAALEPYEHAVGAVVRTSARDGHGTADLAARLVGHWTVLTGHSGVGKSSLTNRLAAGAAQDVGAVGPRGGRHTTVAARALEVPGGGWLVDTPGVRSFGLGMLDRAGLARCFPELADLSCALDDCAHAGEPGCGLPTAGLHPVRRAAFDRLAAALEGVVEGDVADGLGGVRRDDAD